MSNNQNRFEDLYNENEDLTEQRENDDSTTVYYDKSPGGPNGKLPDNGNPKTQVIYLQRQLESARNLLTNKQEKIEQLETALKKSTFQTADMVTGQPAPNLSSEEEKFNIMHNPYWIILNEIGEPESI